MRVVWRSLRAALSPSVEPVPVSPPDGASIAIAVAPTSPARLLADSLLNPDTRGEWEHGALNQLSTIGFAYQYTNKKRDIKITRSVFCSLYHSSDNLVTPFTLSKAEEKVVRDALAAFVKREKDEKEQAALARLVGKPKAAAK